MRRSVVATLAAFFIVAALISTKLSGSQDSTSPADGHDFGSKIVMVTMRSGESPADRGGGHMEKVSVRRLGDRYFLVGLTPVGGATAEYPQIRVWVPLSDVADIVEYDSMEDAKKDYEARKTDYEARKTEQTQELPKSP